MMHVNRRSNEGDVMSSDYTRLTRDASFKRLVLQEELILDVTEALTHALQQSGMSRAELAAKLGRTRGFVSQLFAGGRNVTLRTISDVACALGFKPRLKLCAEDDWSQYTVESIPISQWTDLRERPKIVLHPSSFATDRDGDEIVA